MSPFTVFWIAFNAFVAALDLERGDWLWLVINGGFVIVLYVGGWFFEIRESRADSGSYGWLDK